MGLKSSWLYISTWTFEIISGNGDFKEFNYANGEYSIFYDEYEEVKRVSFPRNIATKINRVKGLKNNNYIYNAAIINGEVSLKNNKTELILNIGE